MKNVSELLKRAIILVCLSDRCAQEKNIIGGIARSLSVRKQQCEAISGWMKKMGYMEKATDAERDVFDKELSTKKDEEVLRLQINYECIEPILWTIGLVDKLSNYNEYVLTDFHQVLRFGKEHSLEKLISDCKIVSEELFDEKREEAMLMYWRCLEAQSDKIKENGLESVIREVLGEQYVDRLMKMESYDAQCKDFIVNKKTFSDLNNMELSKLCAIAERRFYVFEWIASEDDWDKVDLVS